MASILFSLLFKMFFLLLLGYFLRRRGVISASDQQGLMTLLLKVTIPFVVIMSSQRDLDSEFVSAIIITACATLCMYAFWLPTTYFLSGRLGLDSEKRRIFTAGSVYGNVAFIGYPVIQELYGEAGMLLTTTVVILFNLTFFTCVVPFMAGAGARPSPRSLAHNVTVWACAATLVLYLTQTKIPEPVYSTFSYVSDMSMPLSMIVIGGMLAEVDLGDILRNREFYLISLLRLLIIPGSVYLVLRLLGVDHTLTGIITVLSSLPTLVVVSVVAADVDCAPDYAVKSMIQTVIFMLISLPFWAFILLM